MCKIFGQEILQITSNSRISYIVKDSDKEKYVYGGYRIPFDSAVSWSFGNDSARNVTIVGFDNSSSSETQDFI